MRRVRRAAIRESDPHHGCAGTPPFLEEAVAIPFLGQDIDHGTYPLEGAHAEAECEDCHKDGRYAETATECEQCHTVPGTETYPYHFAGACETCHGVATWEMEAFDHLAIVECESCHMKDQPEGHERYTQVPPVTDDGYLVRTVGSLAGSALPAIPGRRVADNGRITDVSQVQQGHACEECHTDTTDWMTTTFAHDGFEDCAACRTEDTPPEHYEGQCSGCHTVESWDEVTFDHTGLVGCSLCHQPVHESYDLACAKCHTAKSWLTTSVLTPCCHRLHGLPRR